MTTATEYSSSLAQSPALTAEIDNVINTALALNRIVGTVIMVAHRGQIVYQRAAVFAAQTPQTKGTFAWGGVYGHSWFVDPHLELSAVRLINTTLEGMAGVFAPAVRDAIYRGISS